MDVTLTKSSHTTGSDRVVDLKFGSGDAICHIILELYASGNIVLTDGNYEIIALLRSHQFEDDIAVKVGEIYPIAFTTTVLPTEESTNSITSLNSLEFVQWTRERYQEMVLQNEEQQRMKAEVVSASASGGKGGGGKKKNTGGSVATTGGTKKQRVKKMNLRQLLLCKESGVAMFGPEILDHCLLTAGFVPTSKVEDFLATCDKTSESKNDSVSRLLKELLETAPGLLALLDTPGQPGYILLKKPQTASKNGQKEVVAEATDIGSEVGEEVTVTDKEPEGDYYDFVPRLFRQHDEEVFRELSSFDEAVDEYFCKVFDIIKI